MGVLRVFHNFFEGALIMSFHECSPKDSNVSVLGFKGVFDKNGLLLCTEVRVATSANSIGQKYPKNPMTHPLHTQELH